MGSKTRARQAMQAAGVPIIPGTTDPVGSAEEVVALGERDRLPAADQGGRRRRRQGDEGRRARPTRRRRHSSRRSARGGRTSPTRRSTSSGTSRTRATSRCRCSPTRTATSSTSASATARSSGATRSSSRRRRRRPSTTELRDADRRDRGRRGARRRLPLGRDDRGPARAGRRLLLHGDEHAHPGRAHGDRARHGHRPRARAGADRRRASRSSSRRTRSGCSGHAIECRINAEDARERLPAVAGARSPPTASRAGPGVRVDSGVGAGSEVSPLYDPMIAKLIVHGADREDAIGGGCCARSASSRSAASKTLIGFHKALLSHPCFRAGRDVPRASSSPSELAERAAELASATTPSRDGCCRVGGDGRADDGRRGRRPPRRGEGASCPSRRTASSRAAGASAQPPAAAARPRRGRRARCRARCSHVKVADGDAVEAGQVICIVEAMKMENEVTAHRAGVVSRAVVAARASRSTNGQVDLRDRGRRCCGQLERALVRAEASTSPTPP